MQLEIERSGAGLILKDKERLEKLLTEVQEKLDCERREVDKLKVELEASVISKSELEEKVQLSNKKLEFYQSQAASSRSMAQAASTNQDSSPQRKHEPSNSKLNLTVSSNADQVKLNEELAFLKMELQQKD